MKLLSLYAIMAAALMVCCLVPSEVLSKPLKKKQEKRGHEERGNHRGEPREGRRGHGKDRHDISEEEEEEEDIPEENPSIGPDGAAEHEGEIDFDVEPVEMDGEDTGNGGSNVDPRSDGQTDADTEGQIHGEGKERRKGDGKSRKNKTKNGWQSRRENMPIRPQYNPDESKPNTGPLGIGGTKTDRDQETMRKAMGYMSQYGYMAESDDDDDDDWSTDKVSTKKMKKSIRMMQKFMGLKETGKLDEMTMMMMDKPRCGVPDVTVAPQGGDSSLNYTGGPLPYTNFGQRWDKQEITFRFLNYGSTMTREQIREAIFRAFQVWADVVPLTFREVVGAKYADFYLKFGARYHGDQFPFDGQHGTLAHAFLPKTNSGDLEGDVHFDDDERFTYAGYDGTNLFQVAAHEIGHSLGMHHSTDNTALMAPFYPGYQPTFYLPYDDLAGIQSLYGSKPSPGPYPVPYPNPPLLEPTQAPVPATTTPVKPNPNPPRPNPTQPPAQPPTTPILTPVDLCPSITFDAVTMWRSELFSFTGKKYGRIRGRSILSREGGSDAPYFFQNFPGDIDAAYENPVTYSLLMFKGSNYYVYNGLMQDGGPRPITNIDPSLPSNVDAVVTWAADKKTYFFKGELVWRYDELTLSVDPGWPYRIDQVWTGVPNGVTAAFHNEQQHLTYFLAGKDYYRYDDLYAQVDVGPRDYTVDYFGCF